jgi:hypothetical protein
MTDLKKIIWHEIGHFCIEIINSNPIIELKIEKNYDSVWLGGLKNKNIIKIVDLVEDIDQAIFEILSLVSGCVFQIIYFKKYEKKEVSFLKDCFNRKDHGSDDYDKFHTINNKLKESYSVKKYSLNYIDDEYIKLIIENCSFIEKINKISNNLNDIILNDFNKKQMLGDINYSFVLKDEELDYLKKNIEKIISETKFKDDFLIFKNKFKEEYFEKKM